MSSTGGWRAEASHSICIVRSFRSCFLVTTRNESVSAPSRTRLQSSRNVSISLPDGLVYSHQEAAVRSCVNVGLGRLCNVLILISIMYFCGGEQSVCPPSRDRLREMNSAARSAVLSLRLSLRLAPSSQLVFSVLPLCSCQSLHLSSSTPPAFCRPPSYSVSESVSFQCTVTVSVESLSRVPHISCSCSDVNDLSAHASTDAADPVSGEQTWSLADAECCILSLNKKVLDLSSDNKNLKQSKDQWVKNSSVC